MSVQKRAKAVCVEVLRLLREERERQGLSKYEVAARSGLSPQMIGYIDQGLRNPTMETTLRIAEALDVDLGLMISKAQKTTTDRD